jgi:hypothetical protein
VYSLYRSLLMGSKEMMKDTSERMSKAVLVKFLVYSVVVGLQLSSWFTVYSLYRNLLLGSEEMMQDISERMS